MSKLSHLTDAGEATMVDVGEKKITRRVAVAGGEILLSPATFALLADGSPKGDVFAAARLAAIGAAKRTAELIPLCHVLPLDKVRVAFAADAERRLVECTVTVAATAKTGVEMEALTGAAAALLTLYDMLKAADKNMVIGNIRLLEKSGGASGDYVRAE